MDMITIRRKLMAKMQSGGRLPAEYQEVEYLENLQSNAYLRIPKSYAYFAESTVCMQIEYLGSMGAESGFFGWPYVCELYIANNKIYHYFSPGITLVVPTNRSAVSPNTKITITATAGQRDMTYMNVLTYRSDAYLFTGRLYYLYAIKDDIKIIDLVPCVRKADGVPGAYDLVNGGFFQSYTGTPFIVPN